jgi:hypothetical protein
MFGIKNYTPPKRDDDIGKLKDSITHKVQPGDMVRVSLGGMRQAVARCISRGEDGLMVEDESGQRFSVNWEHVIGQDGKKAKPAVPVITASKELAKAFVKMKTTVGYSKPARPLAEVVKDFEALKGAR